MVRKDKGEPKMRHRRTAIAIAAAVMSLSVTPLVAHADKPGSVPCAKEQQQVDNAQEALDRLADRKHGRADKKKKKAQEQRLAEAQARLATCQAAQTST
jgi:hypothetical protein